MPTYKLHYFPIRARGEPARLIFAVAGVKYEDVRISFEEWSKNKQKMPFRQMPVLEVDGKQLAQSYAIVRYLANEYGLSGKNKWEAAEADQFACAVEDLFAPTARTYFEKDEKLKAEYLKALKEDKAPSVVPKFEAALANNKSGYLVGNDLTYADLCFFNLVQFMEGMLKQDGKDIFSKFPNIQKHRQKIESLPKIAAWIKSRPASDF